MALYALIELPPASEGFWGAKLKEVYRADDETRAAANAQIADPAITVLPKPLPNGGRIALFELKEIERGPFRVKSFPEEWAGRHPAPEPYDPYRHP